MRKEASENVKDYTVMQLPLQFKICVIATQNAMKQFWDISQSTKDNKEKMQALENYTECHKGLCRFLWEGGWKLEQFLADYDFLDNGNGNGKVSSRQRWPDEGDMLTPGKRCWEIQIEHLNSNSSYRSKSNRGIKKK
jgi:hypothetical protein